MFFFFSGEYHGNIMGKTVNHQRVAIENKEILLLRNPEKCHGCSLVDHLKRIG